MRRCRCCSPNLISNILLVGDALMLLHVSQSFHYGLLNWALDFYQSVPHLSFSRLDCFDMLVDVFDVAVRFDVELDSDPSELELTSSVSLSSTEVWSLEAVVVEAFKTVDGVLVNFCCSFSDSSSLQSITFSSLSGLVGISISCASGSMTIQSLWTHSFARIVVCCYSLVVTSDMNKFLDLASDCRMWLAQRKACLCHRQGSIWHEFDGSRSRTIHLLWVGLFHRHQDISLTINSYSAKRICQEEASQQWHIFTNWFFRSGSRQFATSFCSTRESNQTQKAYLEEKHQTGEYCNWSTWCCSLRFRKHFQCIGRRKGRGLQSCSWIRSHQRQRCENQIDARSSMLVISKWHS